MNILKSEDFGIAPGKEIAENLIKMFAFAKENNCREITFEKGTYYIDAEKCNQYLLHITNTVGDDEFTKDETAHLNAVAFYLDGFDDFTLDGNGAVFIIDGKTTNVVLSNCRNVTVKNIEIRHNRPDMHSLTVAKVKQFYVDFEIDSDTQIVFDDKKPYFVGKDYRYVADKNASTARWIPRIRRGDTDFVERVKHPLCGAFGYCEIDGGFRARFLNTSRFSVGDSFYIYDVRRQYAGIFIDKCENISLENIRQRFNYSLAVVMQRSENVLIENSIFAPEDNSPRLLASCADFVQANMCRGKISVINCKFCGAGDDCANFHGVHFKVTSTDGKNVTIRFMHPQTHGFDPFCSGDKIAFINPKTLRETGYTTVERSNLLNETDIELKLTDLYENEKNCVIENVTACPDVEFLSNEIARIITRGVLVTTRGKVKICDNKFITTAMSSILISDDAENWYESGCCKNVLIENNEFLRYGEPSILIKPENSVYDGAVHENIRITGNTFSSGQCLFASSTDGLLFKDNVGSDLRIKTKNCTDIEV